MDALFRSCARYPLLTREEELSLTRRYAATHEPSLEARLVGANLRLVVRLARRWRAPFGELSDLVQEGQLGLLHAVRRFDPERGIRLASYAAWWIRAYQIRWLKRSLTERTREGGEPLGETPGGEIAPDELCAQHEVHAGAIAFAPGLPAREREILQDRWLTEDPCSLGDLADRYRISRERVRQVEQRMFDRLRRGLLTASSRTRCATPRRMHCSS
jgi:RNA polymerase sigma factor (sigma-70 family)